MNSYQKNNLRKKIIDLKKNKSPLKNNLTFFVLAHNQFSKAVNRLKKTLSKVYKMKEYKSKVSNLILKQISRKGYIPKESTLFK